MVPAAFADLDRESQDSANVGVEIKDACEVSIGQYALPSAGVLGIGRTGSLFTRISNTGSLETDIEYANFSMSRYNRTTNETEYLNMSLQQELYDNYEPLADYDNYSAELGTEGAASFGEYVKAFTASTEYPTGTYNATVSFNYTCYRGPGLEPIRDSVNETKEMSLVESERNENVTSQPDRIGQTETNQAIPRDYTNDSEVEANPTNYTGDARFEANRTQNYSENGTYEANETIREPGDNPNEPGVSANNFVEVQPVNRTNPMERGVDNPVKFEIENRGERYVTDITLEPNLERLDNWESDGAQIENLTAQSSVNRTVNVQPPEDAELGTKIIPVEAKAENRTVDIDYFYADVIRTEENQTVEIIESPPAVNVEEGASRGVPVLIENTGETELTNLTGELQNHEECVSYDTSPVEKLDANGSTSLPLTVTAENVQECEANLMLSSDEGASDFVDITFTVNAEDVLIPERQGPPILAIIWTLVLALYAVIRKKLDWESITAELPLILLVMGETVIILYLTVGYFGFISLPFLPF